MGSENKLLGPIGSCFHGTLYLCRMVEYCLETFSGLGQSVSRERKHVVNELGVGD